MEQLEIFEVNEASSHYLEPINNLLSQLSSSGVSMTMEQLQKAAVIPIRMVWSVIFR